MARTRRASVNDAHPKAWTAKLKPGVGKLVVARLAITARGYMELAETNESRYMKEGHYRLRLPRSVTLASLTPPPPVRLERTDRTPLKTLSVSYALIDLVCHASSEWP